MSRDRRVVWKGIMKDGVHGEKGGGWMRTKKIVKRSVRMRVVVLVDF